MPVCALITRCPSTSLRCLSQAEPSTPKGRVGRRKVMTSLLSAPVGLGLVAQPGRASDTEQAERAIQGADALLRSLDDRVSEFTLPNGLHFMVLERHMHPVASCHTFVNAGAYDEADKQTGLAHLLEHMAFKGTARVGTTDYRQEARVLDALDEAFYDLRSSGSSEGSQQRLKERFLRIQSQAEGFAVPNEYGAMLQNAGAIGLNASTSHDNTRFFVSLPTNALELWFALESERFQAPVFRQLYSEKRVVAEERRLRIDNSSMGPYLESFMQVAFGNNYARPVIGWPQDVEAVGRKELHAFHQRHYRPSNVTIAVVGDVDPARIEELATKYFGSWSAGDRAQNPPAPDPALDASKPSFHRPQAFAQAAPSGPGVMQLYYRPGMASKDALAVDVISDLMDATRGSRLERSLVDTGAALSASAMHAWPGEKHGTTFLLNAVPSNGTSLPDMAARLQGQAQRFIDEPVSDQELARFCKIPDIRFQCQGARADLYNAMQSNSNMASAMCRFHTMTGSWRTLITDLADFGRLTGSDVQRVAASMFAEENGYTGFILPPASQDPGH